MKTMPKVWFGMVWFELVEKRFGMARNAEKKMRIKFERYSYFLKVEEERIREIVWAPAIHPSKDVSNF